MESIFGLAADRIEVITQDGSPSGHKDFIVWNPSPVDAFAPELGRQSSMSEATSLMRFLMKRGIRVILFCKVLPLLFCHDATSKFYAGDPESMRIGKPITHITGLGN